MAKQTVNSAAYAGLMTRMDSLILLFEQLTELAKEEKSSLAPHLKNAYGTVRRIKNDMLREARNSEPFLGSKKEIEEVLCELQIAHMRLGALENAADHADYLGGRMVVGACFVKSQVEFCMKKINEVGKQIDGMFPGRPGKKDEKEIDRKICAFFSGMVIEAAQKMARPPVRIENDSIAKDATLLIRHAMPGLHPHFITSEFKLNGSESKGDRLIVDVPEEYRHLVPEDHSFWIVLNDWPLCGDVIRVCFEPPGFRAHEKGSEFRPIAYWDVHKGMRRSHQLCPVQLEVELRSDESWESAREDRQC